MSWTSNVSGHSETEAEETDRASVLQKAAKYVNATTWSFYGTYNQYDLDSDLGTPNDIVDETTGMVPGAVNTLPGVTLSNVPSIVITDPIGAKSPYTGKGDIPDGMELPPVDTVPPVGSVPDMVPVSESPVVVDSPKV
jgi:hypothetical protein